MDSLKVAVLGIDDFTVSVLEAVNRLEGFEVSAVADEDSELAEKTAGGYDCGWFDDYRQLIIQSEADCLVPARGIAKGQEYLTLALEENYHILKHPPLAKSYEEASALAKLAEKSEGDITVANMGRFSSGYGGVREILEREGCEEVFLIKAFCGSGCGELAKWQRDPKVAGGGVLLHNCYEVIDQLVWNFGLPQQVYSLATSLAGDRQQRLYRTEDVAAALLKYGDTIFGEVTTVRGVGAAEEHIAIYCRDKVVKAGRDFLTVIGADGSFEKDSHFNEDRQMLIRRMLEDFAKTVTGDDEKHEPMNTIAENIRNMVLVESIYLSSRTAMPEEPGRITSIS